METKRIARITALVLVLVATVVVSIAGPQLIANDSHREYKFVRLVDDGAMPSVTEALNREAERGWQLDTMEVVAGNPGAIYLVFSQ